MKYFLHRALLLSVATLCFGLIGSEAAHARLATPLFYEDFNSVPDVPAGWSADNSWGPTHWSSSGAGDYNGCWVWNTNEFCWENFLVSPGIDASEFSSDPDDDVTIEFDAYFEFNGYDNDTWQNNGEAGNYFAVIPDDGSGTWWQNQPLMETQATSDIYTFDNRNDYNSGTYYDPPVDQGYWRHYSFSVPSQFRTTSMRFFFHAFPNWNCSSGNIAIDNVKITGSHAQKITSAPTGLQFPGTVAGTTSDPLCVTITNTSAGDLDLSSAVMSGPSASEYQVVSYPNIIPAFGTADVCVTFSPITDGLREATLNISNGSDNSPNVAVPVRGTGLAPLLSVIPVGPHNSDTKMFASTLTKLGDTLIQSVLVQNSGGGALIISPSTNISGAFPDEYAIVQLPSDPIAPGGIDTVKVRYTPTMEGFHDAYLTIVNNSVNVPNWSLQLRGIGILPRIVVKPSPLMFDSVAIGDTACSNVTIYNPGTDTLVIKKQVVTSNDGDFVFGTLTGEFTSIPPDKSRDINVCFIPKQYGSRSGRLTLFTNIPKTFEAVKRDTASTFDIHVYGTGVPFGDLGISMGGTTIEDSALVGHEVCRMDTLWNFGSADLTITSLSFTGNDKTEFSFSGVTLPLTIQAHTKIPIDICATPGARGERTATIHASGVSGDKNIAASLNVSSFGLSVCASTDQQIVFANENIVKNGDSVHCITVTNCGDVDALYTATVTGSTDYTVTPGQSAIVPAGGSTEFCVHFKPTATGERDGQLTITTANVNPMNVDLKGNGACANLNAPAVSVPATNADGHSTFQVLINNTGNYLLNLGNILLTQPADAGYRIIPPVPTVVPAQGQVTINMGYDPTKINTTYTGELTFPEANPCVENDLKIDFSATTTDVGVATRTEQAGFALGQTYPNPTSGVANFTFSVPTEAPVRITISDLTGRVVNELISGRVSAGDHTVNIDASMLSSGTYLYTLESNGVRLTRYLVLSK